MASLLSLSANPPSVRAPLYLRSSFFKGNITHLRPNPSAPCLPRKLHQRIRTHLSVVNRLQLRRRIRAVQVCGSGWTTWPRNQGRGRERREKVEVWVWNERSEIQVRSWCEKRLQKGFEGAQMPLYCRIPKLCGISGGMCAGLPKYVPVDLKDVAEAGFQECDEVSLETLKKKGLINPSILGDRELSVKLNFKARSFSASAKEKLEAVGCSLAMLPGRKKWVKPLVAKNLARAEEYFAKKRAAAAAEPTSA